MKTTPNVNTANTNTTTTPNADNQTAKGTVSTGKISMTPGEPIPVSDLIKQAHAQTDKKAETPAEQKPYPTPEPALEPAPAAPVQVAPKPEPAPAAPVRSRSEEIEYQIKKAQTMQVINSQLQSLKEKLGELNQFSYGVDKDDDRNYGRVVIYDDNNREFVCRNHGVAALIVANLKSVFSEKVEEKESEFLTVSRS